jgi:serpin B
MTSRNWEFKRYFAMIFCEEQSDLSGVNGLEDFYVTEILHKAVIDVDEEGTTAAAVTSMHVRKSTGGLPRQITFKADHPFLFFIKDKKTDIILFMGRVEIL